MSKCSTSFRVSTGKLKRVQELVKIHNGRFAPTTNYAYDRDSYYVTVHFDNVVDMIAFCEDKRRETSTIVESTRKLAVRRRIVKWFEKLFKQ